MELGQRILFDLFLLFSFGKLFGWLAVRLRQPPVLGELVAGMIIGPYALGLVGHPGPELIAQLGSYEAAKAALDGAYHTVSELGLIFLLFFIGLETRVEDIFDVGRRAVVVATLGVALPFLFGYGYMRLTGSTEVEALFVGAALVGTSTGITARVLRDLGVIRTTAARVILGAAVIDDVLSLLLLAVVAGLAGARRSTPLDIVVLVVEALLFALFVVLVGTGLVRRYGPHLRETPLVNVPFVVGVGACLGLAALAGFVGLSPLVGAFLAGMVLAEARAHFDIESAALPVYELFVPFFFVVTGTQVDIRLFLRTEVLGLTAVLTLLAIAGKFLGCGLGALGMEWREVLVVAVGMVPRGEVGLIAVSMGRALGTVPEEVFAAVVALSVLTTLLVIPILTRLYAGPPLPEIFVEPDDMAQTGYLPNLGVGRPMLGK